jgi:hypothetical protein
MEEDRSGKRLLSVKAFPQKLKDPYPVEAGVTLGQLAGVATLLNRKATRAVGSLQVFESIDRYPGVRLSMAHSPRPKGKLTWRCL